MEGYIMSEKKGQKKRWSKGGFTGKRVTEKGIELSKFYVTRKRSKEGRQKKNIIW